MYRKIIEKNVVYHEHFVFSLVNYVDWSDTRRLYLYKSYIDASYAGPVYTRDPNSIHTASADDLAYNGDRTESTVPIEKLNMLSYKFFWDSVILSHFCASIT